jgi:hypothetical protein
MFAELKKNIFQRVSRTSHSCHLFIVDGGPLGTHEQSFAGDDIKH